MLPAARCGALCKWHVGPLMQENEPSRVPSLTQQIMSMSMEEQARRQRLVLLLQPVRRTDLNFLCICTCRKRCREPCWKRCGKHSP